MNPDEVGARPTCILVGNEVLARRNALVGKIEAVGLEVRQVVDPSRAADLDASTVDVVVFQVDGTKHTHTEGVRRMASRGGRRLITINHQRSSGSWQKLVEFVAERVAAVPCSLPGPASPAERGARPDEGGARPDEGGARPDEGGIDYDAVLTTPRTVPESGSMVEVAGLRRQLREAREEASVAESELAATIVSLEDRLRAEEQESSRRIDELKASIGERVSDVAFLKGKLEERDRDVAVLEKELAAAKLDATSLRNMHEGARGERDDLRAKLAALEAIDAAAEEATAPALDPSLVEALQTLARGGVMTWEEAFVKIAGRVVRS